VADLALTQAAITTANRATTRANITAYKYSKVVNRRGVQQDSVETLIAKVKNLAKSKTRTFSSFAIFAGVPLNQQFAVE